MSIKKQLDLRDLPKALHKLALDPRVENIWKEWDGFAGDNRASWWLALMPGWADESAGTHCLHEASARDLVRAFRGVAPCTCAYNCQPS